MWILGLDTSTALLSLALMNDERARNYEFFGSSPLSHNEEILKLFIEACKKASISPGEIGKIVLGLGPGSFTGLRIAFAFAKGLCLSLQKPISGISSFMACASEYAEIDTLTFVISDAKRKEVFFAAYRCEGANKEIFTVSEERIVEASRIQNEIAVICAQEALESYIVVSPCLDASLNGLLPELEIKGASHLGLNLCRLSKDQSPLFSVESLALLEPNYVRRPAAKSIAERKRDKGKTIASLA
ncbi:MAG: tRNA (adenosine(37)-N6)-threonylcarbamoyltransferase complex dimerization subunit type 1 TsaB [SAR324 cluster bacterium]|uniref:tRNA (Adenosine(37)-N6)-threonylcarbamoyltransferase complex dimerization subunit type 1 TsaB n=1 Tax=SAR324 cluster bacterium TaxID=2024889 RepID=A0A7X9FSL9_9DELT|nr:tRNA (adenosine(37)-N6)-threonylcarbamoyltransferase complex dimerization subunit type 1 TsaB [SAR324 cluster bacterium]